MLLIPPRKLLELNGVSIQPLGQTSFDEVATTDSDVHPMSWSSRSHRLLGQHIETTANPCKACPTSSWNPETLPVEIWQYIFQILASTEHHNSFGERRGAMGCNSFPPDSKTSRRLSSILPQEPSKVSQVCNQWRMISLSMPELWNILQITEASFHASSTRVDTEWFMKVAKLVHSRLCRTSSSPLKISITVPHNVQGAQVLLRSLLPFCVQWETLYLHVPFQALSEFLRLRTGDMPLLTSVKLHHDPYNRTLQQDLDAFTQPNPYHICSISPSLRHLCTTSLFISPLHAIFCASLHELNIQQSPSDTWSTLRFLALCPQLRVLTLRGYGITMNLPMPPYPEVVLPELETLNLEHPIGRDWLLKMLNVPKLKSLWLGGRCDYDSVKLLREINNLVMRSQLDSLEYFSLELQTHGLDTYTLVDFLKLNPLLHQLSINDAWTFINHPLVTSEFFTLLTLPSGDEDDGSGESSSSRVICPRLRRVSFMNCSTFDGEALSRFLRSRMKPRNLSRHSTDAYSDRQKSNDGPGLKVVDILLKQRLVQGRITIDIQALRAAGLAFHMTSASRTNAS